MKNILIVDDQTLNQTLVEAYIQQYGEEHNEAIEIKKANNGLEAVELCQEEPFDLIFMDIVMPVMSGIEATKHIAAILPKAIIVIVSTQGDEKKQIQALRNGAKDYCIKPIQPDIFKHRLHLYLTMINAEKGIHPSKQSQNLFTNTIFCYKTIYLIEHEEDLAQLWESLLFKVKDSVRTNLLSDLIRFIYQLGQVLLSRKVQPEIIMEENEYHYFFSLLNINTLSSKKIIQLIENYFDRVEYRLESNLLSFKIAKEVLPLFADAIQAAPQDKPQMQPKTQPHIPVNATYEKEAETLRTFDFMEAEDISSLELKLGELSTQFMWMGSNELNAEDVDQIVNAFERLSSIMLLYTETQSLGIAIRDLATIIRKDEAAFIAMASQMSALCKSFTNDLTLWFKSVFYKGAPSANYMDASIISNIQMVQSFLQPHEETSLDDADGFEFF